MRAILDCKIFDGNKKRADFQEGFVSLNEVLPGIFSIVSKSKNILQKKTMAWRFFLKLSGESLRGFIEKKLFLFDAVVGENRCELRAFYFLDLMHEYNHHFDLQKKLKEFLSKIELLNNEISLSFIENNNNFDLQVPKKIAFLIFCFILTIVKEDCLEYHIHKTNEKKLMNRYEEEIPYNLARILVNKSKKYVSKESILFLEDQAKKLGGTFSYYIKYLKESYVLSDKQQIKLPFVFFSMKIILDRILRGLGCVLSLKINFMDRSKLIEQRNVFFEFDFKKNKIKQIVLDENRIDPNDPIYVVEGCCVMNDSSNELEFVNEKMKLIENLDIVDIILSNSIHKTNHSKLFISKILKAEDENLFHEVARLQDLHGHSIQNPSVFCVSHVSCLTLKEALLPPEIRKPNYLPKVKKQS